MAKSNVTLNKSKKELAIKDLVIKNPDVITFLSEEKDVEAAVRRAIIIGCVGLKQMKFAENVDFVEKAFNNFLNDAKQSFKEQSDVMEDKLNEFFDENKSNSMIAKFKKFLEDQQGAFDMNNKQSLFAKFKEFMETEKGEMTEVLDDTFSLEKNNSAFSEFKTRLDDTFNMKLEDSPLYQFRQLILEYFDSKHGKLNETMKEFFDSKDGQIKKLLDQSFDIKNEDSSFRRLLDEIKENTDLEEEKIQELLDSNKTDSPMKLFKEDMFEKFKNLKEEDIKNIDEKLKELKDNEIKDIRDEVLKKKNIEEEKLKGTRKGFDFEDEIHNVLEDIASLYEDKVTHTGDTRANKGLVGDFCIDLNGNKKKRVVVECKDSKGYRGSVKKTINEIHAAIKNRDGKFGIFIFKNKDQMPPSLRPIKITDSYVITTYEKENVYFAYRLARLLLLRQTQKEDQKIDFAQISRVFSTMEDKVQNISEMKKQASGIVNSGNYIYEHLGDLMFNLESSFQRLKTLLGDKVDENADVEKEISNDDDSSLDYEEEDDSDKKELSFKDVVESKISKTKSVTGGKVCPICGESFESKSKAKKYCSTECKAKLAKVKDTKYLSDEEQELKDRLEKEGLL